MVIQGVVTHTLGQRATNHVSAHLFAHSVIRLFARQSLLGEFKKGTRL